jgi:hypothetical protein
MIEDSIADQEKDINQLKHMIELYENNTRKKEICKEFKETDKCSNRKKCLFQHKKRLLPDLLTTSDRIEILEKAVL